ncbi:hypothetical protein P3342_001685 [Pyrenophora teres f. teres]|nr:hypothetical protein P3342_001685 [Pyrenophora teres f. teres]
MATESDPAVTRVTVILNTPDDWFTWLFIRRDVANRNGLWQYIDPDPQLTDYMAGATRLSALTADDRESYRWECDRWERRRSEYRTQKKALADLNTDISKTIAVRHIHLIKDHETPYDRLVALKKFLCPTDSTRRRELADKYNALKTAPRAAKKVEQWLVDWTYITAQGKSVNLPETDGNRPQEDFLIACKALDQEYATSCLREIFKHEARGTTAEITSLETYVAEMTTYLRRTKPHTTGLAVAAADLGITKPTETSTSGRSHRDGTNSDGARPIPTCVCGKQHWYSDCYILNPRHPSRPKTYQPPAEAVRKVEQARKDHKVNARIKSALDKWAARQSQSTQQYTGTLRIDNGKAPDDNHTFVMSMGIKLGTCDVLDNQNDLDDIKEIITIDSRTETADALTVLAIDDTNPNELLDRWIVDPGSNTHVINSESWQGWEDKQQSRSQHHQRWHWSHYHHGLGHDEPRFLTSILGLARCRSESIHFDSGRDVLYMQEPTNIIAQLKYNGGHWLIDADPSRRPPLSVLRSSLSTFGTSYRPSYAPKPDNIVDRRAAHQIWGHPGRKAVDQLEPNVIGVQLTGDHMDCLCQTCIEARMAHIVSRRPSESRAQQPFYRIAIDIIYIIPVGDECIDGSKYAIHAVDEYTKWHEISTIKRKDKTTLIRWFMSLIRRIQRVYNADVVAIRCDNEAGFGNDLINMTEELGILYESAPPGTKEPNGLVERAGGVLTQRARAMRLHSQLPKDLSHEMYRTAAYILNRTPTEALGWKTPYEAVWGRKPLVAHMRPIGCRAYVYNRDLRAADKLESRTLIGHLVGYQGTNIFRIWLPTKDTIIVTRDVVFEPTLFFKGMDGYASTPVIEEVIELLEYPEVPQDDEINIEDLLTARQRRRQTAHETSAGGAGSSHHGPVPGPSEHGPVPGPSDPIFPIEPPEGYRRQGDRAPHDVNLDPDDPNLIVTGKRQRKKRDLNTFTVVATLQQGTEPLVDYLRAFSTELLFDRASAKADEVPRIHQTQLPPLPKSEHQINTHKFGKQFRRAIEIEWQDLCAKEVFEKTTMTTTTVDGEVLPLMWVYTYKTDGDGYLSRFKARLVVRGDLQAPLDNTYATTLAIRNFRALIAIANYFDLELKQYDVPTAFLNARINRTLYAETPAAFRHTKGEVMRVLRALYGLKESPVLWYNELRRELVKLGLKPVDGFPCLYTNHWLILFFYVDDIVMAFHRSNVHLHKSFEQKLEDLYNTKAMGDLTWFLGIRVIRDRDVHKTWLIQDAFIDKVCARFGIETTGRCPDVPLTENWLPQSNEEPDAARTKLYQQLVGSLAYIAVWVGLTSPVRQTWRYLLGTKSLALEASANAKDMAEYLSDDPTYRDPLFFGSSDASYADEPETRRSSQGYVFKFGGLMIDWKSTIQRTVTKSTTESELLSLSWLPRRWRSGCASSPASILLSIVRLLSGVTTSRLSALLLRSTTSFIPRSNTLTSINSGSDRKSPHYVSTSSGYLLIVCLPMASQSSTKQKFVEFIRQLGLVDIAERLKGLRQANGDDLDGIYIH